jgi:putative AdoMet-dependent methyltransferase
MLEKARELLPDATLIHHDLSLGLPELDGKFNAIVSTYAMHHFDAPKQAELIGEMLRMLAPNGKIYIGDVVFADRASWEQCRMHHADDWDESEFYIVYAELLQSLAGKCRVEYDPVSWCGGMIMIESEAE